MIEIKKFLKDHKKDVAIGVLTTLVVAGTAYIVNGQRLTSADIKFIEDGSSIINVTKRNGSRVEFFYTLSKDEILEIINSLEEFIGKE